jgi:hypothetical protein
MHNHVNSVVLIAADHAESELEAMRPHLEQIGSWALSNLVAIRDRRNNIIYYDELGLLPRPTGGSRVMGTMDAFIYQRNPGTVPGQPEWDEHFKVMCNFAAELGIGPIFVPVAYPSFTFITPAVPVG